MRLINIHTVQFQEFADDERPPYAIASHRWGEEETSYKSFLNEWGAASFGRNKVQNFAKLIEQLNIAEDSNRALSDLGLRLRCSWLWIDTACINGEDSAELSESINSMFRWYGSAAVCYAYLGDVLSVDYILWMSESQWFKRGWTLQELLAPRTVVFVARGWTVIGHKCSHSTKTVFKIPRTGVFPSSYCESLVDDVLEEPETKPPRHKSHLTALRNGEALQASGHYDPAPWLSEDRQGSGNALPMDLRVLDGLDSGQTTLHVQSWHHGSTPNSRTMPSDTTIASASLHSGLGHHEVDDIVNLTRSPQAETDNLADVACSMKQDAMASRSTFDALLSKLEHPVDVQAPRVTQIETESLDSFEKAQLQGSSTAIEHSLENITIPKVVLEALLRQREHSQSENMSESEVVASVSLEYIRTLLLAGCRGPEHVSEDVDQKIPTIQMDHSPARQHEGVRQQVEAHISSTRPRSRFGRLQDFLRLDQSTTTSTRIWKQTVGQNR
ncbi:Putative heterokaryon incompatibility [Septoria linicola]|uniref:Heterokaryon incompatibility n=1 Tax=Septoria linicola TaxID=215465 RepID=A0A9Q9AXA4_9PEZI|nr:Putative heterokaryon incompatibility [Septoria linicola]